MQAFLIRNQIGILIALSIFCGILAVYSLVVNIQPSVKKKSLFAIETVSALLLFSDALQYAFSGNTTTLGIIMCRMNYFFVFAGVCIDLYFVTKYAAFQYMGTGRFEKLPKRLLLCMILSSLGVILLIINLYTGMFYYFDEYNRYNRGPLFMGSYIMPVAVMIIFASFMIEYIKVVSREVGVALLTFAILPFISGAAQVFFQELSLVNISICMCAAILFGVVLADQNKALSNAASIDAQTGLPNIYGYRAWIDNIIQHGDLTKYCAMQLDIVHMGRINERYGSENGNTVIFEYAETIRATLLRDEILARLGGNFFVALIRKENIHRFLRSVEDIPITLKSGHHKVQIHVKTIVGGYEIVSKSMEAGQIVGCTSVALSYAKNVAHTPYVFLDDKLQKELNLIRKVEENTIKAIENEEFVPYYQPKVDARTRTLCGAEALARWVKDGQVIPPMSFIPAMEKNGSVCDLDFYMLEHVCRDIKQWIDEGKEPVQVSVNFSRKNLGNYILAEAISKVVEKYDIPKDLIQIEVTETLDEYPMDYLSGVVEALQRYGMSVAIDDFGTGSSSINLLKVCKFDVLKIDKSFSDYSTDKDKQLLEDIIHMAKNIGIDVIAEGIEYDEQVEALDKMGCYAIQGYFFDKPLMKSDFEQRLASRKYF